MIDTVRFGLEPAPFADSLKKFKTVCGSRLEVGSDGSPDEGRLWKSVQDESSGLRVFGHPELAQYVEVSLPRLIYGTNGKLLREDDFKRAYDMMVSLVREIVPGARFEKVKRLDLVWQFEVDSMPEWIACFREIRHPLVRRPTVEYFGTGLEWPGKNVRIRGYDKMAESQGSPGKVLRLEVQLRGEGIPNVWICNKGFHWELCYQTYRALMLRFVPRSVPRPRTLVDFLSWINESGLQIDGERPLDVYCRLKGLRQRRRVRKAVQGHSCPRYVCDLESWIPEGKSPVYVDVLPANEMESAKSGLNVRTVAHRKLQQGPTLVGS